MAKSQKRRKNEQSFVVSWELFIPGDTIQKPRYLSASADLKCRSHSLKKKKKKKSKCTNYWKSSFSTVWLVGWLVFVWFCLNGQEVNNVAGIQVEQTRRHKSNTVFMDQGTCILYKL